MKESVSLFDFELFHLIKGLITHWGIRNEEKFHYFHFKDKELFVKEESQSNQDEIYHWCRIDLKYGWTSSPFGGHFCVENELFV